MHLVQPHNFHRLALAVDDVGTAEAWLTRVLGAAPIGDPAALAQAADGSERDVGDLAGTATRIVRVGGQPVILLGGGLVTRFLERHGPGAQSWAWEVDDNWEVEHIVRDRGIDVISPNLAGRFFFMQPKQTFGLLWEWCDGKMPPAPSPATRSGGVVTVDALAWVTGVVADADATAEWITGLMEATPVEGNATGSPDLERTIDLAVGNITVRLVTPLSPDSRYAAVLDRGARVHSFALRVPDLDAALAALDAEGVAVNYRDGALAATEPASTLGLAIDWTE